MAALPLAIPAQWREGLVHVRRLHSKIDIRAKHFGILVENVQGLPM